MVIDTNVVAYAVMGEPVLGEESLRVLETAAEVWVPDSIRPELCNVIWQWTRFRHLSLDAGIRALRYAEGFFSCVVSTEQLWEEALRLAVASGHAAYDTLFVALATQRSIKLVTYDKKLLTAFPEHTITARNYLDLLH